MVFLGFWQFMIDWCNVFGIYQCIVVEGICKFLTCNTWYVFSCLQELHICVGFQSIIFSEICAVLVC